MAHHFDQGFLSHTTTARPFWVADVDVSRLRTAPRLHQVSAASYAAPDSLRSRIARVISAVTGN